MKIKAYVRGWTDQQIDTVLEYFTSESGIFASVIVNGVYANVRTDEVVLEAS